MKKKSKTKPTARAKIEKREERLIPFFNTNGDRIYIPESYTIDDLLEMGITEIKWRKESFLPDGWYKPKQLSPEHKQTTKRKEK